MNAEKTYCFDVGGAVLIKYSSNEFFFWWLKGLFEQALLAKQLLFRAANFFFLMKEAQALQ